LLGRLKEGTYGEIYNYNPKVFERIMDDQEIEEEGEEEEESDENEENSEWIYEYDPKELEDEDDEIDLNTNNTTQTTIGDIEDTFMTTKNLKGINEKRKGIKIGGKKFGELAKKKPKVEVEEEYEYENQQNVQDA